VILASLLLKLGGYGFLRFSLSLLPGASTVYAPLIFTLALLGIVFASLSTLRQLDLKRVIAYSSIAHMNLVVLGIFSNSYQGVQGSIFLMIGHGIISGALFLMVGMLYLRYKERIYFYYGGIALLMPLFSFIFFFFFLANISLPGTCNFVGEFLILLGIFQTNFLTTIYGCTSVVLCAAYSIWIYNKFCCGTLNLDYIYNFIDLTLIELKILCPFLVLTIFLGIYPSILLNQMESSLFLILFFLDSSLI
jgi:NADH-quinone oxidoreductase subunit M